MAFIVPTIIALLLGGTLVAVAVVVQRAWRNKSYTKPIDWRENATIQQLPLKSSPLMSKVLDRHASMKKERDLLSGKAVRLQQRYVGCITAGVMVAVYSFACLAVSTIWTLAEPWRTVAIVGEILGLSAVPPLYYWSRFLGSAWRAARVRSEIYRQASTLIGLLQPGTQEIPDQSADSAALASLSDAPVQSPSDPITSRSARTRLRQIMAKRFETSDMAVDVVALFLRERVVRQLHWFQQAIRRLAARETSRSKALLLIFLVAFTGVLLKAGLEYLHSHEHVKLINLLLVVTSTIGGATTAYYVAQNQRSLLHRYRRQEASIAAWLATFLDSFRNELAQESQTAVPRGSLLPILNAILSFEDMMADELDDWVMISEHDANEIAL